MTDTASTMNTSKLSPLMKAHTALTTHLSQDNIDTLAGQMLAAEDERAKRDILLAWYTWLEAETKFQKVRDSRCDMGLAGSTLTVWAWRSRADVAREKVEALL